MMRDIPRVAVLLAAYSGRAWIEEQINSILNQSDVSVTLYVSVDLSGDGTNELVEELALIYENIVLLPYGDCYGGAAANFFRLIRDVDFSNFDYVSLSDQDDIWNMDKLKCACELLSGEEYDVYSSNVTAFWEGGGEKLINKSQAQCEFDYLFESAGPGCTFVCNKEFSFRLQERLIEIGGRVTKIWLHDWFSYSFARSNGYKWFIDHRPSMMYRQHSNNQVGANVGFKSFYNRALVLFSGDGFKKVLAQAVVLDQESLEPIKLIMNNNRFSFFKLSFYSFKCRRKFSEKVFFFIACILMVIKGSVKYR